MQNYSGSGNQPQGLHPPQGLQGLHAAQGLHGLQALQEARTMGFSPAETAVGSRAAPAVMVTTVTATMVSFNIVLLSPLFSNRFYNGENAASEKGSRRGIAIS